MKLLFLSNEFPNQCEPTKATFNYDLLTSLARDHEVTAVSPISWSDELRSRWARPWQAWTRTREIGGLTVHHPRFFYTPGVFRHHYGRFLWWSLRRTVRRLLRGPRPDCVLSYWTHPDGEAAVRLAKALGVPSIVMVGGSDVLLLTREPRRRACIERVLRQADAVVAVSQDLADKIVELGADRRRVHVMKRGVDSGLFAPGDQATARRQLGLPQGRQLLLWVGRMVPVKGLDTLLAACEELKRTGRDFELCLIGDGPLRGELAADADRRGLGDNVRFVGSVAHDQLGPWFQAADLTVLPSRSEGIPNVLLESLACGTPFVASAVGGIPEIANHTAARLVPPDSPRELGQAIEAMLNQRLDVPAAVRPDTLERFAGRFADLAAQLAKTHGNRERESSRQATAGRPWSTRIPQVQGMMP